MSIRKEMLRQDQTIISVRRLHELLQKEAQLDGYVRTGSQFQSKVVLHRQARAQTRTKVGTEAAYHMGWLDCWADYNDLAMSVINRQWDSHPHLDDNPPPVRKGQTCLIREPGCYCLAAVRD